MPKQRTVVSRMEGEASYIAKEDAPPFIFQKLENLRPAIKIGSAVSRDPYTNVLTSGLTAFQTMKEFKDSNDGLNLVIIDNNGIEESVYSAGYGAIASITNDERTAGSTIYGSECNMVSFHNDIRAGAGLNAATDRPFWYSYFAERKRYNDNVTITAGKYLYNMYPGADFEALLDTANFTGQVFAAHTKNIYTHDTALTAQGVDSGFYRLWFVPVFDDYQRGFPTLFGLYSEQWDSAAKVCFEYIVAVVAANNSKLKRLTAIDVFVGVSTSEYSFQTSEDAVNVPAYFLERIDMNDDGNTIMTLGGTLEAADPPTYIEFTDDFALFETFLMTNFFASFTASASYDIKLGARTENSTKVRYALSGLVNADNGLTVTCQIHSRWYDAGTNDYVYKSFYDNYYKILGSEMYTYLNLPTASAEIDDFRFRYYAWNGVRGLISGLPGDSKPFSYYTPTNAPDVFPNLNIIRHKSTPKGNINIDRDFLVFTDKGTELIRIIDNANAYQDEEYLDAVITSHRALAKVSDDIIAFMTYNGPYLIQKRSPVYIGKLLRDWWVDTFTKAQLEACVVGYNYKEQEIWFSFPTYTTAPYTAGICFVFDLKAYEQGYGSAWWRVKTDTAILAFETNNQFNLLGGTTTGTDKIVDFNTAGSDEEVQWKMKLKVLENPLTTKKVRFDRIYADVSSDDTVLADIFIDGTTVADLEVTFDGDLQGFIRYIGKTMEVELYNEDASANSGEIKRVVLTQRPLRKNG